MLNSTKKFLSTVFAAVLTCSAFAVTATADNLETTNVNINNEIHNDYTDDYELELINSGRITDESIAEFNDYIASLDEESAALILDDSELVLSMKMTTYWHPDNSNDGIATYANKTLPLPEYPVGSYFSYDGKACTCHDYCSWSVPTGYSKGRCYIPSEGKSGNCIRYAYNATTQCMGFADYVFEQYNGVYRSSSNAVNQTLTSITSTSLKNYATKYLKKGSHFRVYLNQTYGDGQYVPHSIVVTDVSANGISYY